MGRKGHGVGAIRCEPPPASGDPESLPVGSACPLVCDYRRAELAWCLGDGWRLLAHTRAGYRAVLPTNPLPRRYLSNTRLLPNSGSPNQGQAIYAYYQRRRINELNKLGIRNLASVRFGIAERGTYFRRVVLVLAFAQQVVESGS